jgi:hypothetical protein
LYVQNFIEQDFHAKNAKEQKIAVPLLHCERCGKKDDPEGAGPNDERSVTSEVAQSNADRLIIICTS